MFNTYLIFTVIGIYVLLCGLAYYLIFREHHKRNKVELGELIELVTKFYSITTISILMICFGIYLFIQAAINRYDLEEVIDNLALGIFIISAVVFNYINYLKNSLKDFNQEIRIENQKKNAKIGQILEIIIFILLALTPIYRIPTFNRLKEYKPELYIEIVKSCLISISSIFLLYNLNPLNIKEKIFKKKDKEK